jgi:general secretion pathway protein K
MTTRPRPDRGAALLVAITAVAIVTAVAVDLAYNTRVSLQTAANSRDELRATYLAKSAVNMSRLVLHFQQQLDAASTVMAGVQQAGAALLAGAQRPGAAAAAAPAAPAAAGLMPSIGVRLWDLVPVDSAAVALFLGADSGGSDAAPGAGRAEV